MHNFLKLSTFLFLLTSNIEAANSLSYSGRLVQTSGAPVNGPVNLRAELVYTNATSTVLCSQNLTSVALTKGVFHLKLDLNCTPKTMIQVLSETPNGESVAIRIIDQTNSKTYPLQAIHSVPFSKVAEQLPQMGASTGQALAWDGAKWAPTAVGTGNGTVTNIVTGTGLTGGPISTTGTISVAAGGITSTELAANSVTAAKINAGEITNSHISATAAIPYSKLSIGVGEIPQDRINGLSTSMSALIEDVIADAVTGKAPSQNAVYDALGLKADRSNVAQNITAASVVGLTAPTIGSAAANRDYVDNSATTLDTRITNEVATLNTTLGTKYDKSGGVITGDVTLNTQLLLKGGANFVTVKANSGTANYTMTLPTSAGTTGYVLQTDGAGVLSWVNPSSVTTGTGTVNSASITDGSIVDADINASANIAQSKIAGLTTDLSNKEPSITAGTATQYWRGNKTWSSLQADVQALILNNYVLGLNSAVVNTDSVATAIGKLQGQINATNSSVTSLTTTNVSEGTNLYFTEPRVLGTDLMGFNNTLTGPIVATDTVLQAFGRTQKQINDLSTSISGNQWTASGGNVYRPSGNVGINIATPASALDVNGTIRALEICDELGANCKDISTGWGAAAGTGFGSWETRAFNTNYQASTDGFAVVWGAHAYMLAYSDSSATPTTKRMEAEGATSSAARPNLTMPVKKGDYWRVDLASGSGTVYWISLAGPDTGIWTLSGANAYKTTGNIGIGTSTPAHKLDVSGNVNATQVCIAGDCKSAWPTGVSAGSITTTEILDGTIATADIADGAVSLVKLGGTRDATKYLKGDNTWATFATDAINSVLSTFTVGTGTKPTVTNTDTVVGAFGKVQKTLNDINADYVSKTQNQTINGTLAINSLTGFITVPTPLLANDAVNKSYVDGLLTWIKSGSDIYYTAGSVGIGTNSPATSTILDLTSTTKGFSPPRMTLTQRNAIASPIQGLIVFNTTDNTLDYYNGSAWLALNGSPKYIKLVMSGYQSVDNGSTIAFDTVNTNSGMTRVGNGIQLKAGVTYRIEASINTYQAIGNSYLGYILHNGTSNVGLVAYTNEAENTTYGFKSSILEIYKPTVDEVISVRITDDNIGTGQITPNYNTYLMATEIVPSGPAGGGGSDNLGNHTASQNISLGSNWLSGDGGAEGIKVDANGNVGIGVATPLAKLHIGGTSGVDGIQFPDGTIQTSAATASGTNNSMVTGWPDYITCNVTNPNWGQIVLPLTYFNYVGNSLTYYRIQVGGTTQPASVMFTTSTKTQSSYETIIASDCDGKTVAQLYASGKAFNIAKGPAAQWLLAGSNAYFNAGNVGVGTNAPDRKLSIDDNMKISDYDNSLPLTNTPSFTLKTGSAHTASHFPIIEWLDSAGTRGMYIGWGISGSYIDMRLENNNNLAITNGNVGIGTTTPAAKLDVAGEIKLGNTSSTCNAGNEGQQRYNSTTKKMQFCNGTAWTDMGGGTAGSFGGYESKSADTVYLAATDGYVIVNPSSCAYGYFSVYVDGANPPTTEIIKGKAYASGGTQAGATVPVPKNNYWKVTTTYSCAPDAVRWVPVN